MGTAGFGRGGHWAHSLDLRLGGSEIYVLPPDIEPRLGYLLGSPLYSPVRIDFELGWRGR